MAYPIKARVGTTWKDGSSTWVCIAVNAGVPIWKEIDALWVCDAVNAGTPHWKEVPFDSNLWEYVLLFQPATDQNIFGLSHRSPLSFANNIDPSASNFYFLETYDSAPNDVNFCYTLDFDTINRIPLGSPGSYILSNPISCFSDNAMVVVRDPTDYVVRFFDGSLGTLSSVLSFPNSSSRFTGIIGLLSNCWAVASTVAPTSDASIVRFSSDNGSTWVSHTFSPRQTSALPFDLSFLDPGGSSGVFFITGRTPAYGDVYLYQTSTTTFPSFTDISSVILPTGSYISSAHYVDDSYSRLILEGTTSGGEKTTFYSESGGAFQQLVGARNTVVFDGTNYWVSIYHSGSTDLYTGTSLSSLTVVNTLSIDPDWEESGNCFYIKEPSWADGVLFVQAISTGMVSNIFYSEDNGVSWAKASFDTPVSPSTFSLDLVSSITSYGDAYPSFSLLLDGVFYTSTGSPFFFSKPSVLTGESLTVTGEVVRIQSGFSGLPSPDTCLLRWRNPVSSYSGKVSVLKKI